MCTSHLDTVERTPPFYPSPTHSPTPITRWFMSRRSSRSSKWIVSTWMTLMLSPVSLASCSLMCLVGFGVAAKAAFNVSSCLALIVVRGPLLFAPAPPGRLLPIRLMPTCPPEVNILRLLVVFSEANASPSFKSESFFLAVSLSALEEKLVELLMDSARLSSSDWSRKFFLRSSLAWTWMVSFFKLSVTRGGSTTYSSLSLCLLWGSKDGQHWDSSSSSSISWLLQDSTNEWKLY